MSHLIIEGVAQLVQEVQQKLDDGELHLSAKEWAELDRSLDEVRPLLAKETVKATELEDAAWLLVAAFEENETLAEQFDDKLARLTGGTKLTGRVLHKPQGNTYIVKNKMIMLSFTKQAEKEAQTSRPSNQQRRTRQRS